ncbi:MAG TPA: hypothetical protein VLL75_20065 [Vicinamibacteria bacterium]|nr:hypothetical protein [Vicinamibacteria bacterium]
MASSLDGCIAGPHDEFDWIEVDPRSTSGRSSVDSTLRLLEHAPQTGTVLLDYEVVRR